MSKSFHLKSRAPRRFCQFLLLCAIALAAQTGFGKYVVYYVAPTAVGTGDGSSAANAASYLSGSLWGNVHSALAQNPVEVWLVNGTYSAGELDLTHLGDPVNRLSIEAQNYNSAVFSSSSDTLIKMVGSQNIKIAGITFSGSAGSWGINIYPDGRIPAKNILIQSCNFQNLTSIFYGGIGIQDGARDVSVDHCNFSNVGTVDTAHSIYVSHDVVGVNVTYCGFTDTAADYVRFRDDCEYCVVAHCTFHSTKSSTCFAFIRVPMFNDTNPGTDANTDPACDYFGTYFQVNNNSFTYDVAAGTRAALQFSCDGYNPRGLHTALTPAEATSLNSGTTSSKQSFLSANMAIVASGIKMFGNTYSGVSYDMAYTYNLSGSYGGNGWSGTCNISDVPDSSGALLATPPGLRNGTFAAAGYHMRDWLYGSTVMWHPGIDGTVGAARFGSVTANQDFHQWMPDQGAQWTLDFVFLVGSDFTGTGVKFRADILNNEYSGDGFSLGVDNLGRMGVYNGGTFVVLPDLGSIAFSVDNNANGYYNDSGDVMNWYHVQVVGNYTGAPRVDVYRSSANTMTLSFHGATDFTNWVGNAPISDVTVPSSVTFKNYNAKAVVDGVSLGGSYPSTCYHDDDGDLKYDYAQFCAGTPTWRIRSSATDTTVDSFTWGHGTDIPFFADVSGDGKANAVARNTANAFWYVRNDDATTSSFSWGVTNDTPLMGDFYAHDQYDFCLFRSSTAVWYVMNSANHAQQLSFSFGNSTDIPLCGDVDGGGKADAVQFRPSTSRWYVRSTESGSVLNGAGVPFGTNGDIPMLGDFTGDGRADFVLFRPSDGTWHIMDSQNTNNITTFQFGQSGDVPMIGKVRGGAKADAIIFRPSTSYWYTRFTDDSSTYTFQWGDSTYKPVP